jgi:hypothetical protein
LKLLLDTHHSRFAAQQLRQRGHDIEAAADDPLLAALPDEDLLRAAARHDRVVVTGNAQDFDRIARAWAAAGEHHAGIIFTSPRRYHRGSRAYPANLTAALAALLDPSTGHPTGLDPLAGLTGPRGRRFGTRSICWRPSLSDEVERRRPR